MLDWLLHLDLHLAALVHDHGALTYLILFGIVFVETGVVIMPFLPGDSLLFVSGTMAAQHSFQPAVLFCTLAAAAVAGDSANYGIGRLARRGTIERHRISFLSARHLERTEAFFDKHGPKTVVLARFVPVVRTLAPFVAALGAMHYGRFMRYNVVGGVLWVGALLTAGYLLGSVGWVKDNLTAVLVGIVVVSLLPGVFGWLRHHR